MKNIEGPGARKPPACKACDGTGKNPAEVDGWCTDCCGLGVDSADWWWEIAYLRNRVDQLAHATLHGEGRSAFFGVCLVCLQDFPCEGFIMQSMAS